MKKIEAFVYELEKLSNANGNVMTSQFHKILRTIYELFSAIKLCNTPEAAGKYFRLLGKIQVYLARLTFVHEVSLPQELMKIVRDFDRIDDEVVRNFLYDEIKSNRYDLKSDSFLWYE